MMGATEDQRDAQPDRRRIESDLSLAKSEDRDAAFQASEERLRLATEAAGMFVWEGEFLSGRASWSANTSSVVGCAGHEIPAELAGTGFFIHPEDLPQVVQEFWDAVAERRDTGGSEFRGNPAFGAAKFYRSHVRILYDEEGRPIRVFGVAQDISARKRVEDELVESERFARRVLDNLFTFAGVLDGNCTVQQINPVTLAVSGLTPEDVIGLRFWDVYWWSHDPALQSRMREACERALSGELVRFDVEARIAGDQRLWVDFQVAPLRDGAGRITHLIPSAMDIAARREAESALQVSEERLRLASEATGFGTYDFDPVTRESVWSRQLYQVAGLDPSVQPEGKVVMSLIHPEDRASFEQFVQDVLTPGEGGPRELEFRVRRAVDGEERWVRDVCRCFFEPEAGTGELRPVRVVGTIQDITRRKHAELQLEASVRELRSAQGELIRRERLSTLGQLAGGVAHELRTPLGILRNSIYYLSHVLPPNDTTMQEVLGEMQRAIGSSDHIIGEMLDFVREPSREATDFPAANAISRALAMVTLPRGIKFGGGEGDLSLRIRANEDQATRILVNLIQNSVQAMAEGGRLRIIVSQEGQIACIAVADTGCGIPSENLEKVFDPLFTTKTRGIGLGLAIARRYARLHGGGLSAESQVGEGTTFRLTLPMAAEQS